MKQGTPLRTVRLLRGHTLREVAAMTGLDYVRVWRLEVGKYLPRPAEADLLADALGVNTGVLLGANKEAVKQK